MSLTALQVRSIVPSITVNDLKKSLAFYRDGLGFTVGEEFMDGDVVRGMMLEAGEFMLGISQDDFAKGRDRVKGLGMRIYIETDQDIEALAKHARAAGITTIEGPVKLPWGPLGFSVTDPDGFKLTVSEPS